MSWLRSTWRRCQLPNTAALVAALLLLPSAALLIWPRPQAVGLGRILAQAQLMQSFAASPGRPLPGLWQQRLGASAAPLWARQVGVWWQFWGAHGDAGAYLVLPASNLGDRKGPRWPLQPLVVDDLAVFAADPLSRQWLADRLRTISRPPRGLEQRCLQQLRRPQTVVWSAGGLGALAGPVAPLLQRLQQGCLTLDLSGHALGFSGEAASSSGVLGTSAGQRLPALSERPLPQGLLLELSGPSLDVLLQGLLARQLVREPLAARYGIAEPQLALLRRVPFVLRLREQSRGAFQASLDLELAPSERDRQAWAAVLRGLRDPLQQQGLQEPPPRLQSSAARLGTQLLPAASWTNDRGDVVGGWFWRAPTLAQTGAATPRLVLFLGPSPQLGLPEPQPNESDQAALRLRARPADLQRLGLFPQGFPQLIRQASGLELLAGDGAQQPLSRLTGRLLLSRSP